MVFCAYEENRECDFSFSVHDLARFRVNALVEQRGAGAVFRTVPSKVLSEGPQRAQDAREHGRVSAWPGIPVAAHEIMVCNFALRRSETTLSRPVFALARSACAGFNSSLALRQPASLLR
jgi:hypothetical protein